MNNRERIGRLAAHVQILQRRMDRIDDSTLAARIEALEKRVRTGADYRVMQDQINKLRANMDRDPLSRYRTRLEVFDTETGMIVGQVRHGVHEDDIEWAANLPPNGPTVQLPADSDALIDVSAIQEQVNKSIANMEMARQGYSPRAFTARDLQVDTTEQDAAVEAMLNKHCCEHDLTNTEELLRIDADQLRDQLAAANEHIAAQDSEIAKMRWEWQQLADERDDWVVARDQAVTAHARTKELLGEARHMFDLSQNIITATEKARDEARRIAELMRPHVLNPFAKTLPWMNDSDDDNFNQAFT